MFTTGKIDWGRLEAGASEQEVLDDIHKFLSELPSKTRETRVHLTMPYRGGPEMPTVEFKSWLRSDLIKILQQLEREYGIEPDLTQQELFDLIKEDVR